MKQYKIVEITTGFDNTVYVYKKVKFLYWSFWKRQIAWDTYAGHGYEFSSVSEAKEYIKMATTPTVVKETFYS